LKPGTRQASTGGTSALRDTDRDAPSASVSISLSLPAVCGESWPDVAMPPEGSDCSTGGRLFCELDAATAPLATELSG
jgi:hypothetical protein